MTPRIAAVQPKTHDRRSNDMRVGTKIVAAVAILAAIGTATLATTGPAMSRLRSGYENAIQRDESAQRNISRLREIVHAEAAARHTYLVSGRSADHDALLGELRRWDLTLDALHHQIGDEPAMQHRLDEIADQHDQLEHSAGAAELDLAQGRGPLGAPDERASAAVRGVEAHTELLTSLLDEFERGEQVIESRHLGEARETVERARAAAWAAIIAIFVIAIFVGVYLLSNVKAPIEELTRMSNRIAGGQHQAIGWRRRDELGDLGRAIEAMSDALAERERQLQQRSTLLSLDARLGAALSTARDVRAVSEASLKLLAEAIGAFGGVIFVRDGNGTRFAAEATFGATRPSVIQSGFEPGDGILGDAVRSKEVRWFRPAPDEAPRLETATADVRAVVYGVIPIQQVDEVVGVLELACAQEPEPTLLAHLGSMVDPIGVALWTAIVARERDKLHERLEAQYAEVRAREERLRSQSQTLDAQARELSRKNEELQIASQMKSQFIATMSHELRTPLNSILGFTDLLLQRSRTLGAEDRQTLGEVRSAGRHLLSLINDILDLARIGAGRLVLRKTRVQVASIVREVLEVLRPQAEQRSLHLESQVEASAVVDADPSRLRQVLLNLVGNAVKFTDQGSVTVRTRTVGDRVRVEVVDTGPGISAPDREKLFREFSQLDTSGRRHEGSGLGLAIARELVIVHGGEIGVDSEPGHGSVFWFTMPVPKRSAGEPELPAATQETVVPASPASAVGPARPITPKLRAVGTKPESDREAPPRTRRVLLVEDHPRNARLVEAILAGDHVAIEHVSDGLTAVERALADPPSLVLLDLELPGIDGFEVARRLRADARTVDVPIVAVTARALPADEARARAIGCNDFIPKPIEIAKLRTVIANALRPSGARVAANKA